MNTLEKAQETLVEYLKEIRAAVQENSLCIDFFDPSEHLNETASLRVRQEAKGTMNNYIEYKVNKSIKQFNHKDRFLIHSVYLEQGVEKRCPVKTLAIFLKDFDYADLPICVQNVAKCHTKETVRQMADVGMIPPTLKIPFTQDAP